MDTGPLDLVTVADFSGVQRTLRLDVELNYLPVYQLQQVQLICHSLDICNAMFWDLYNFFAVGISSIEKSQYSCLRSGDEEITRDRIDPNCARNFTLWSLELHLDLGFVHSEKENCTIIPNYQENILTWVEDNVFDTSSKFLTLYFGGNSKLSNNLALIMHVAQAEHSFYASKNHVIRHAWMPAHRCANSVHFKDLLFACLVIDYLNVRKVFLNCNQSGIVVRTPLNANNFAT